MRKKRVLLLSEGFGAGHTQAAHAIAAGIRKLTTGVVTRVLELGTFQHPLLSSVVFSAYRKTVTSHPGLYGKLYRSQSKKSLNPFASFALHWLLYSKTDDIISQLRPDVVVCTHPFPSAVVSRLKRSGLDVPLCAVVTDYDAHGSWVDPAVNVYLVSTPQVKEKFVGRGVPEEKIIVTGIPVHPKFWESHNRSEIRREFGLKPLPTVLMMGGGWGLIHNEELIHGIARWKDRLQLIICCGRNEKARLKLAEDPLLQHPNVHLLGYTRDVDKLMDVSDLLVTKPGGLTCTEAMAMGVPMLFYNPIPGQEEENSRYFIENSFAERIDSPEQLDAWMNRLVHELDTFAGHRLQRLQQGDRLYRPEECPEAVLSLLGDVLRAREEAQPNPKLTI